MFTYLTWALNWLMVNRSPIRLETTRLRVQNFLHLRASVLCATDIPFDHSTSCQVLHCIHQVNIYLMFTAFSLTLNNNWIRAELGWIVKAEFGTSWNAEKELKWLYICDSVSVTTTEHYDWWIWLWLWVQCGSNLSGVAIPQGCFSVYFSQQWMLDKQDLLRERQQDLKILTEDEYQKVMIFFANCGFGSNVSVCVSVCPYACVLCELFFMAVFVFLCVMCV